jgi:hypothetical protein
VADARWCSCGDRRFVRSLEEDEAGLPGNLDRVAATNQALLGACRPCGTWWERLPREVYSYAWYQTKQRYWDPADSQEAIAGPAGDRQSPGY